MKKTLLVTGLLTGALFLQACSGSSENGPLMEALESQRDAAKENGTVFIDFSEVYPDHDEYLIVCQEAHRDTALELPRFQLTR